MDVRELPPHEWYRLLDVGDEDLKVLPTEEDGARVFVQEDHLGDIVGYWVAKLQVHIEPAWVRPDHRGGLVVHRMWKAMRQFLDTCSISQAFCFTGKPLVQGYLERLGLEAMPEKAFIYQCNQELPAGSITTTPGSRALVAVPSRTSSTSAATSQTTKTSNVA
jgi:hypothetical protein